MKGRGEGKMKRAFVVAVFASLLFGGCMTSHYGQYERRKHVEADTLALSKEDVIALSKEGVGDQLIIDQIKATRSYFELTKDDIIDLKRAGVSEKVIQAMIKSGESVPERRAVGRYYGPGYYSPYYDPWYSSFSFGLGYRYYYPRNYFVAPHVSIFRGRHR
jgi:hypothetical protein